MRPPPAPMVQSFPPESPSYSDTCKQCGNNFTNWGIIMNTTDRGKERRRQYCLYYILLPEFLFGTESYKAQVWRGSYNFLVILPTNKMTENNWTAGDKDQLNFLHYL